MSELISLGMLFLAGVVIWRIVCVAGSIDVHSFDGHRMRFAAFVVHWALLGAGSLAVVLGEPAGGKMLLLAAVLCLADRRGSR